MILEDYLNELFGRKKQPETTTRSFYDVFEHILWRLVPAIDKETVSLYIEQHGPGVSLSRDLKVSGPKKIQFFDMVGKYYRITFTSSQIKNTATLGGVIKILNSKGIKD